MIFEADDKVCLAHLALALAVMTDSPQHNYTTPIDTSVPRSHLDRSTPQAQTRYDYEDDLKRRSARMSLNLASELPGPIAAQSLTYQTSKSMMTDTPRIPLRALSLSRTTMSLHSRKTTSLYPTAHKPWARLCMESTRARKRLLP